MNEHSWWLISRSAGIVALLLVAASVLIGLTLAAGLGGPPPRRKVLTKLHEHAANTALPAIGLHGVALLGDGWLNPSPLEIAVPLTIGYRPAFTAAGILAAYLAVALGASFYIRRRVGAKRWRKLHRATPAIYLLALVHTVGAGTDAGAPWLQAVMIGTAAAAAGLVSARLMRRPRPAKISVNHTEI